MQDFSPENIQENAQENVLYVVATPIGNLGDITLRALDVLRKVSLIACEDSRVTNRLLNAYKITGKKLLPYNDFSDEKTRHKILHELVSGGSVALVSDAGMPLISDPGHKLIKFLREHQQKVVTIPGASSLTSALSISGLACDNFLFIGFLPASKVQKKNLLKSLPHNFTFAFFEAPNRVSETLELLQETLGERRVCVARELTKIYEEVVSEDIEKVRNFYEKNSEKLRGEFVIIVEKVARGATKIDENELRSMIKKSLKNGESAKDISQNLAEIYQMNRKEIYQMILSVVGG